MLGFWIISLLHICAYNYVISFLFIQQFQRGYGCEDYGEELEDDEVQYTDEEDEEGGEYEEDDHKPTQEELEYLEIRQRLKEAARKRLRKEAAPTLGYTQDKKKQLVNDK